MLLRFDGKASNTRITTQGRHSSIRQTSNSSQQSTNRVTSQFQQSSRYRDFHRKTQLPIRFTNAGGAGRNNIGAIDSEEQINISNDSFDYNLNDGADSEFGYNFEKEEQLSLFQRLMTWFAKNLQNFRYITIACKVISILMYILRTWFSQIHYNMTGDFYKEKWPKWSTCEIRKYLLEITNNELYNSTLCGQEQSVNSEFDSRNGLDFSESMAINELQNTLNIRVPHPRVF